MLMKELQQRRMWLRPSTHLHETCSSEVLFPAVNLKLQQLDERRPRGGTLLPVYYTHPRLYVSPRLFNPQLQSLACSSYSPKQAATVASMQQLQSLARSCYTC